MKKLPVIVCALSASAVLSLSGCYYGAINVPAVLVGSYLGQKATYGNYSPVGNSWRLKDTDIRKLTNSPDFKIIQLAQLSNKNQMVQILPDTQSFRVFDANDLATYRQEKTAVNPKWNDHSVDYYAFISLDMKDKDLSDVADNVLKNKGLVLARGLKNDSLSETFKAAKVLTDKGAIVLLAPAIMEQMKVKRSPTFADVVVAPDGSYGCTRPDSKSCATYSGQVGFLRPLFEINL
ncbi:TrbC family F-type conjugative pilus assembly protein [Stenoxybacter acetivorans]|uniref:TrbC family F-type conjugative pilus assembly protein n=1 Tax=Stenoxybacter acetivorans TaxID=422441 RepID=UPI00056B2DBD|nr:TrbC family F-type conjugative pilus assembly protein [Stenoxybacter acetivorans]